jgi:hypothetical protein
MANVGLPIWQVLQNFAANSTLVSDSMAPAIANFQNLLLDGQTPAGNLLTLSGAPGASLTLTTGVDTPTQGFSTGHGATAINAGAVFSALPGTTLLGLSNTLNAGDDLEATGAAAGASTLNYTAITPPFAGNPPDPLGVTMNGVSTAVITNLSGGDAGFSGNITGLTTATVAAASINDVEIGTASPGLNTALTTVNLNAAVDFTALMTAAALAAAPTATINLSGVTDGNGVDLEVASGTAGYSALTINSNGTAANDIDLDVGGATNTAMITAAGAAALTLTGDALEITNLHTFAGGTATGDQTVTFENPNGTGHVDVTGGSGTNTFIFDAQTVGATIGEAGFTAASTVNGGTGTSNILEIGATHGDILATGVGPNITGIAEIEHFGVQGVGVAGLLTADLSRMGSATTFDLGGAYDSLVTVSNITNAQTVEYSGTSTAATVVALVHANPVVATDVVNFEMNAGPAPGPAELTLNGVFAVGADLPVVGIPAQAIASLNIDSTGSAGDNAITDALFIGANINVTGATHLTLGSAAEPYAFATGTINATAATGGVSAFLAPTTGTAQTFEMGAGTNLATLATGGGGVISFAGGGTDTVAFHAFSPAGSGAPLNDNVVGGHFYNNVLGFTTALGSVNIGTGGIPSDYTDGGAVAPLDATSALNFTTGTSVIATTVHNNLINITTPITSAPGESVDLGFATAIGAAAANGITVAAGVADVLTSFYDTTTSEAVLVAAAPVAGHIGNTSPIAVVGLIHESAADYAHIASNVHFVA